MERKYTKGKPYLFKSTDFQNIFVFLFLIFFVKQYITSYSARKYPRLLWNIGNSSSNIYQTFVFRQFTKHGT